MGRSASQPVQTPGAPAPDTAGSADDSTTATQEQAALTTSTEAAADPDARIAELEARIAELEAQLAAQAEENERLRAAAAADPKLPQVVYEPETPHGKEKLAASATAGMTVAQVQQAIDDKRLPEPITSYLCADGYYARRG